jgi:hypothetical protein
LDVEIGEEGDTVAEDRDGEEGEKDETRREVKSVDSDEHGEGGEQIDHGEAYGPAAGDATGLLGKAVGHDKIDDRDEETK